MPASMLSQSAALTPALDNPIEGVENVTFTLIDPQLAGHDNTLGPPSEAEIIILDLVDRVFIDGFEQQAQRRFLGLIRWVEFSLRIRCRESGWDR